MGEQALPGCRQDQGRGHARHPSPRTGPPPPPGIVQGNTLGVVRHALLDHLAAQLVVLRGGQQPAQRKGHRHVAHPRAPLAGDSLDQRLAPTIERPGQPTDRDPPAERASPARAIGSSGDAPARVWASTPRPIAATLPTSTTPRCVIRFCAESGPPGHLIETASISDCDAVVSP